LKGLAVSGTAPAAADAALHPQVRLRAKSPQAFHNASVDFNTDRRIGNAFDLSLLAGEFLRKWLSYAICNKTVEVAVGEP
jgi:hypothetical protein